MAKSNRLPDFLIAGAPRSGTTWICNLLLRHPDIYLAQPFTPEPKFFLVDELYVQGLDYYSARWFQNVPPGRVAGEKSTNYLESAVAAQRIRHNLKDARLVFLLRDPVERAYSNYLWSRKNGLEKEGFAGALKCEEEREANVPSELRYARPHAYFSRGLYADLLRPYFELFAPEQILCLRFEDMLTQPEQLAERLHRFLEVSPRPEDAPELGAVNESDPNALPMPLEVRRALADRYREPNRRLAKMLGAEFWPESTTQPGS